MIVKTPGSQMGFPAAAKAVCSERECEEVKIIMDNAHPYTSDKHDCAREDHTQSEATEPSRESCSDGAQEEEGSELRSARRRGFSIV